MLPDPSARIMHDFAIIREGPDGPTAFVVDEWGDIRFLAWKRPKQTHEVPDVSVLISVLDLERVLKERRVKESILRMRYISDSLDEQ